MSAANKADNMYRQIGEYSVRGVILLKKIIILFKRFPGFRESFKTKQENSNHNNLFLQQIFGLLQPVLTLITQLLNSEQ